MMKETVAFGSSRRAWARGIAASVVSGPALLWSWSAAEGVTFLETAKLLPSDLAPGGSAAGASVALDGGVALIGGNAAGAAWLFGQGSGGWSPTATLTPPDEGTSAGFAFSVAIDGPWAVIGSAGAINESGIAVGAADVFRRDGAGAWSFFTRLWADDGLGGDRFGSAVAMDGLTMVVGADAVDAAAQDSGAAYVFEWSGNGWEQTARLIAADGNQRARLGQTVAISGTTIVAGAPRDDDGGLNAGAAYVFDKVAGAWQPTVKLKAADAGAEDRFAVSIDIDGDSIIAGAYRDGPLGVQSGSAYIFERSVGQWSQAKKLIASDGQAGDNFGVSVAIAGELAAAGSFAGAATGRVYLFEKLTGQWTETGSLLAGDGQPADHFGAALAFDGLTLIVGATGDDDRGMDAGAAYLFQRGVRGDMDGNGVLDAFDVDDFELALADRAAYMELRPGLDPDLLGDMDANGVLDAFDVTGFEAALAGGIAVPHPASGVIWLIGGLARLRRRGNFRQQG